MKTSQSGSARRAIQVVLAAGVAVGATQAMATDIFLKISGLPGESADSKHKGEIDVLSFSQSVDGGKQCPRISLVKLVDKTSPSLAEAVASGRGYPSATFTLRKSGEKGLEYYKLTLSSVFVLSSDQSFSGEDSGYEAITITARTTSMTYREQQENGTVGGETSRTISNCSTGNTR